MFVNIERNRRPLFPWATTLIVAICVTCFVWLSLTEPQRRYALIAQGSVIPARMFDAHSPTWQMFLPAHLLRSVTALFIHADWLHLLGNLLFLVIFGLPAERALGWRRFLALFLIGGALANLVGAFTLATTRAPIVGCSGAVSAVVGTYLGLFPRARLGLVLPLGLYFEFVRVPATLLIGLWVLLQLLFTYVGPSFGAVVWWTHIAGFAGGLVFAWISRPALARRMRR